MVARKVMIALGEEKTKESPTVTTLEWNPHNMIYKNEDRDTYQ